MSLEGLRRALHSSLCLSAGWNMGVMMTYAAAILDHEVEAARETWWGKGSLVLDIFELFCQVF
jgi:hypothetical protein